MKGVTKEFPGVKAIDNVHFQLKQGEIHALMGENGAGKSTFIKIMTGVHTPNEGDMYLNGKKMRFSNTNEAQEMGIAAIYQHVTSYPHLSVTENIFMGHEKIHKWTRRLLWKDMHAEAKNLLRQLGSQIDPKTKMEALSVAEQQIVEIAKAISTKAKIIIMDEPTAALTARESEQLYNITEHLRDQGTSIILISHRFEDMYRLASRVTVLRDGQYMGTWRVDEITNEDLIVAMVGRKVDQLFPEKNEQVGKELLRVEGLSKTGYFADVSFTVHKGEVLGITGLVGAKRTEVCQALFGIIPFDEGSIYLEGEEVNIHEPQDAMDLGIGYLPEDRQQQGLVLQWEIGRNITLPTLHKYTHKGWLNEKKEAEVAKALAEKVNVKANSIFDLVSSLSGGNQQKVVVAKLLTADLKVIILDEPTKGVDVGAKATIYELIHVLASQGYGVIMVSSEMPEVLGMSDRIVVMREGRVTRTFHRHEATQESILEASMDSVSNHVI
nr:sugar ABC transporter ATP-binding protein [Caldalkalibacillus salinus]